jgi:hypothetical protein
VTSILPSPVLPDLAGTAWFACLGFPLSPADERDARDYLDALGYPAQTRISGVTSWKVAEAIARDPCWDQTWWAREEGERSRLMALAQDKLSRDALLERLTVATELASQAIHGAAAIAAERDGVANAALVRAASGAASMALHGATLARLAGQGRAHLFVRKYHLFESGRWPLGLIAGVFYLF